MPQKEEHHHKTGVFAMSQTDPPKKSPDVLLHSNTFLYQKGQGHQSRLVPSSSDKVIVPIHGMVVRICGLKILPRTNTQVSCCLQPRNQ